MKWLVDHHVVLSEVINKAMEHAYLVGLSVLLAMWLAIPLGILASQYPRLRYAVLTSSGILWTIPSLALFACLVPLTGIGMVPALIGLTSYGLLPIIRGTLTSLNAIDPHLIEAAHAIGLNQRQVLLQVSLPLAIPEIIASIKNAAIMATSMATLATFVGGGGLGDFIYQGLTTQSYDLIWLGAIPVATMAILLEWSMTRIEHVLQTVRHQFKSYGTLLLLALFFSLLWLPHFCVHTLSVSAQPSFVVAGKTFTEQHILMELMAQVIERHLPFKVVRRANLGTTAMCHQALIDGQIDLYAEYTGTAYHVILQQSDRQDALSLLQIVRQYERKRHGLIWLQPFAFENPQALLVTSAWARQHDVVSISDLKQLPGLTVAGPPEFLIRADALPGLKRHYQLQNIEAKTLTKSMLYSALEQSVVDVIVGFTTDSEIRRYDLHRLKDDQHFFLPYQPVPLLREDTLQRYPQLRKLLADLADAVRWPDILDMIHRVEDRDQLPQQVAQHFLETHQLI